MTDSCVQKPPKTSCLDFIGFKELVFGKHRSYFWRLAKQPAHACEVLLVSFLCKVPASASAMPKIIWRRKERPCRTLSMNNIANSENLHEIGLMNKNALQWNSSSPQIFSIRTQILLCDIMFLSNKWKLFLLLRCRRQWIAYHRIRGKASLHGPIKLWRVYCTVVRLRASFIGQSMFARNISR